MVKLATAREMRMYGSRRSRERSEYTNAGLYMFSTIVLLCGFVAQLSREAKSGLVVLLIGLGLIILVNIHDLVAHLAGINYRFRLMEMDAQLLFVEIAVPVVLALGGLVFFIAILLLVLQVDRGFGYHRIEAHVLKLLIAGTSLWVLGSIHNSCQIYEQADWNVQILQHSVQIPFLMASLLFLTCRWVWIGIIASSFLVIGGFTNVVKVVKMLQMEGIKLEKLRGGAQEQLVQEVEGDGHTPFLIEERQRRRPRFLEEAINIGPPGQTYHSLLA